MDSEGAVTSGILWSDTLDLGVGLTTTHGRATPLVWQTVSRNTLAGNRNRYEDEVIETLHELHGGSHLTLLTAGGAALLEGGEGEVGALEVDVPGAVLGLVDVDDLAARR